MNISSKITLNVCVVRKSLDKFINQCLLTAQIEAHHGHSRTTEIESISRQCKRTGENRLSIMLH